MDTLVIVPITSSVSAGTDITLPNNVRLKRIGSAYRITMSDATVAGACSALTVVTTTPASGQIYLSGERTIQVGDDLTTRDIIVIYGIAKGEIPGYGDL